MGYLQFESENPILALPIKREQLNINDSVAQLVEQMTLNHWVESSILSRVTRKTSIDLIICRGFFMPNYYLYQL